MARAGFLGGVYNAALFNLGNAARYADNNARLEEHMRADHLFKEVVQQPFGNVVIGYNAVPQRAYCGYVARRAAKHPARLFTYCQYASRDFFHGDHARLPQHNALAANVYQNARRAKVYAYVVKLKQAHIINSLRREN